MNQTSKTPPAEPNPNPPAPEAKPKPDPAPAAVPDKKPPAEKPLIDFVPDEESTQKQLIERMEALEKENKRMARIARGIEKEKITSALAVFPKKLQEKYANKSLEEIEELVEARNSGTPEFITNEQIVPSEPVRIKKQWNPMTQDWSYQ